MPPFAPSYSVSIDAPPELVWSLLRDTASWQTWNDFTPQATLTGSSAERDSQASTLLQVGDVYKLVVQSKVNSELRNVAGGSVEEITEVVEPRTGGSDEGSDIWRAVWEQRLMPSFLLRTRRSNEIIRAAGGCQFTTSMTFSGSIVWLVKMTNSSLIVGGLQLCAEGLKREAEKRAGAS